MKWADSGFQAQLGPRRWIGLLKHQGTGEILSRFFGAIQ